MASRAVAAPPQIDWSKGMIRDVARNAMQDGTVYNSQDFLLDQPGKMRKRGGTAYAGPAMTGHSVAYAQSVAYFESSGNVRKLLALGDNGYISEITSGASTEVGTQLFAASLPICKPKQFQDKMIFCSSSGSAIPKYYDNAPTTANLSATAPTCKHVESWGGHVVLANTGNGGTPGNYPHRLWWSPAPNPTGVWDVADAWWDHDYAITGLAATATGLVVFSRDHATRIKGNIPPGTSGSDMEARLIGSVGCTDARSICVQGNSVIFASPAGIYTTNGVGFDCLTEQGQIDTYWTSLFTGYDRSSWTIAAELWGPLYFVTIMNGSTLVDTLVCNIPRRAWWRLNNIKACSYVFAGGVKEELYYADRSTPRVVAMSSIFNPSSTYKNDADGTAVTPQADLIFAGRGPGLKHFGFAQLSYDMRDSSADNPILAVSVAPGLEATTFAAVAESPLAETTDLSRKRFAISKVSQTVNVRLAQSNASSKTEVYGLEYESRFLPQLAGGQ